jgi:menaquinone-specific isochorismate synthase
MNVPEAPFVLHLPNVMHLATDVAGVVHDAATVSSLELAASLHPRPPSAARPPGGHRADRRDRGHGPRAVRRPVGWMDAAGDGEWGIALRSAELHGDTVRLFAGCGIVADSDPRPSSPRPRPSSSRPRRPRRTLTSCPLSG